jgi:hypothetical protein
MKLLGGKGFTVAICVYQDVCVSSDWREGSLINIMVEDGRDCVERLDRITPEKRIVERF